MAFDCCEDGMRAAVSALNTGRHTINGVSFDCNPSSALRGLLGAEELSREGGFV